MRQNVQFLYSSIYQDIRQFANNGILITYKNQTPVTYRHITKYYKMRTLTLLILITINISAQATDIDYKHKQLQKQLSKLWDIELSSLYELTKTTEQIIGEGKIYKVETNNKLLGYVYIGRVISCRADGCSKVKTSQISGDYEYFDMFIIYNSLKGIEQIKVFNYQATHGYEVCSKGWLKQFVSDNTEPSFEVGKSVDSISGATISVYALTDEVNYINGLVRAIQ